MWGCSRAYLADEDWQTLERLVLSLHGWNILLYVLFQR